MRNHGLSLIRWLVCLTVVVQGASASAEQLDGVLASTQRWLDQAIATQRSGSGAPLRMEVTLGALDTRLKLAPCTQVEPYLPTGMRLWGRTRLGLRCLDGIAKWNVFLPVTVKALGTAWVVKGDVAAGTALREEDLMEAQVDWAQDNAVVLTRPQQWQGQVAARALTTGETLRQGMLKPMQVFDAGAQVRVVAQGQGFHIVSDGQAMAVGIVGQPLRVRMPGGRILSGSVLDDKTVQVSL